MLREILRDALEAESDMEVVAELPAIADLIPEARRVRPAVVFTGTDDAPLAAELLELDPHMKVFSVAGDARQVWLYELQPHRIDLCEISPNMLVREIRHRTAPRRPWTTD
jgi:hypothetical protein